MGPLLAEASSLPQWISCADSEGFKLLGEFFQGNIASKWNPALGYRDCGIPLDDCHRGHGSGHYAPSGYHSSSPYKHLRKNDGARPHKGILFNGYSQGLLEVGDYRDAYANGAAVPDRNEIGAGCI